MEDKNDLSDALLNAAILKVRKKQMTIEEINKLTKGSIQFHMKDGTLYALLRGAFPMPPAIEGRCDVVCRQEGSNYVFLKYLDNPLPPPTKNKPWEDPN